MTKIFLAILLAVAACNAAHVLMERVPACVRARTCADHDWHMGTRATGTDSLTLTFAVKNANMDKLNAFLATSATADRWMTRDEVRDLTLNVEGGKAVRLWMQEAGFVNIEQVRSNFLAGSLPVAAAERLFRTQFFQFRSQVAGRSIARALAYSVPAEIASLIDFVDGTVQFPQTTLAPPIFNEVSSDAVAVNQTTLALIDSTYEISNNVVASTLATQSLFESLGQSYAPTDLTTFEKNYGIPTQDCVTVIGPNTPSACSSNANNCVEADLDVEYIIAVAQKSPTTYWSIKNSVLSDIFLDWATAVAETENPPYVHSISYGGVETASGTTVSRCDEEITKMNAMGLTVMVSSGDDGVAGSGARKSETGCGFNPTYPGELPHIVSVGATMGPEYKGAEIACTSNQGGLITTGGGFSTVFTAPDWQANFTSYFIKHGTNMPPANKYNGAGRGYPDVSMLGHNYMVVVGGKTMEVSGTSASSPVFAGVVTLANAQRLAAGKKTLGWLTPDLYAIATAHPEVFNDITSGENNCAAQGGLKTICCSYGFTATKSWDPVTGLGSVNYSKILPLLLAL